MSKATLKEVEIPDIPSLLFIRQNERETQQIFTVGFYQQMFDRQGLIGERYLQWYLYNIIFLIVA